MPTTWATTRVCAVHVVELLKVPNYWLCLPMSHLPRSFLSLYNCSFVSHLPRGLNDVQLSVSRTAVLLVVKKRGTDYRGYCGFVLGHTACSASAWPCWKSGRMEIPSGVGRPAVFFFFFLALQGAPTKFRPKCSVLFFFCHCLCGLSWELLALEWCVYLYFMQNKNYKVLVVRWQHSNAWCARSSF